jgi:hypothetical protein
MTPYRIVLRTAQMVCWIHLWTLPLYYQLIRWAHRLETKAERQERLFRLEQIAGWFEND